MDEKFKLPKIGDILMEEFLIDGDDIEEGFYITEEVIDEISGWKEGFTTIKYRE